MSDPRPIARALQVEYFFATIIVGGLLWALGFLYVRGYLPQPFFYEPQDTWMDWFNTAYWSHHPGAYDTWGTIYPPLSFVVLKYLTFGGCYTFGEQYPSRDCDWYGVITLHLIYVMNVILIAKTFIKLDRRTALPRSIALAVGLPMLFAFERGNIILLCFTCLMLAYGPLVRSARLRWVFAGLAINFKVYLIGTVFAQLLNRRWRWFEGAMLATILVYLVSFAIIGEGTPREMFLNISTYAIAFQAASLLDLWYAVTYKPLISLLSGEGFSILNVVGSKQVEIWSTILPAIIWSVVALIAFAACAAAFRPRVVPTYRLVALSIAAALVTSEAGGYTMMFLLLFVFMEPWRGFGRIWSIVSAYILCIPADFPIVWVPPVTRESFLGGTSVVAQYAVGIGPFLRPGLLLSIAVALSCVTLRQVWLQLRAEGWGPQPLRASPPLTDQL